MQRQPTLRAIVCDDDVVLRDVLGTLLGDAGFHVVAEADASDTAAELVDRHPVDVVVVDLALAAGSGEALLDHLRAEHRGVQPVVFSAFADDHQGLRERGAAAVFDKPDFEGLDAWLRSLTDQPAFEASPEADRRRPPQPAPVLPERVTVSPSGLEHWLGFRSAVDGLWPGDAMLALDLLERGSLAAHGDPNFLLDHRLSLGRQLAHTLRHLDRIGVTPSGIVVCLLVAAHPEAPAAVFERLEVSWDGTGFPGTPIGAFAHVRPGRAPATTLERVLAKLADPTTTADHPLRLA